MHRLISLIAILFPLVLLPVSSLSAKELPMELSINRNVVEVSSAIELDLRFNDVQGIPALHLPPIDGFSSQYLGPSTVMSIVNGKISSSVTHRYLLVALKAGTFNIGPFSLVHEANTYKSESREVTIIDRGRHYSPKRPQPTSPPAPLISTEQLNDNLFLIISAKKTVAYLNERIPVTVKLYVNQLTVRNVQYPIFEGQGYIKEGFDRPRQYQEKLGGTTYNVVEFNTYIYAPREGKINLGAAQLKCNIVSRRQRPPRRNRLDDFFDNDFFDDSFFGSFFGRVRVHSTSVKSTDLALKILPFPEAGKPPEFSGAVGTFRMNISAAPRQLKAGDPITLKMQVSGSGNFDSVDIPVLSLQKDFKIYQPEVQKSPGFKSFEQVIIPQSEKVAQIPAIRFAYLDPDKKEYIVLEQEPIPIAVSPPEDKEASIIDASLLLRTGTSAKTKILGEDIVYIKDKIGKLNRPGEYIYQNRLFIGLQFLPLILFSFVLVFQRRKERLSRDLRYALKLRAPKVARAGLKEAKEFLKNNKAKEFYDIIFKTVREYLGHRFGRPSAGITLDLVDELIEEEGLDKQIGELLKTCFSDCDMARYSVSAFDREKMRNTLQILEQAIDYLERRKK